MNNTKKVFDQIMSEYGKHNIAYLEFPSKRPLTPTEKKFTSTIISVDGKTRTLTVEEVFTRKIICIRRITPAEYFNLKPEEIEKIEIPSELEVNNVKVVLKKGALQSNL